MLILILITVGCVIILVTVAIVDMLTMTHDIDHEEVTITQIGEEPKCVGTWNPTTQMFDEHPNGKNAQWSNV